MSRLVKTERWRDIFWNDLHPYAKILLCYAYDTADNAGFLDFAPELWLTQLKGKSDERYPEFTRRDLTSALIDLKEKLLSNGKKKLFIKDFLKHQMMLPLKKGKPEHDLIISKLQSNLEKFNNAPEIQVILDGIESDKPVEQLPAKKATRKKSEPVEFIPPTLDEFVGYFEENGYSKEIAERAWKGYDTADWHDSKGNKVRNWMQKCQNNWFKPEHKIGYQSNPNMKQSKTNVSYNVANDLTRRT